MPPVATGPDPVFGHVAPPDAAESTLTQEVLQLFDEAPEAGGAGGAPEFSRSESAGAAGRGWRYGLIAGAAVVVAVTVGVAGGFFSGGPDPQAGPSGAAERVTVSDPETPETSSTERQRERADRDARPSPTPTETASEQEAEDPEAGASAIPSASPSSESKSPKPSRTSSSPTSDDAPTTLRRGDHGEQVVELQQRLRQLQLYVGPVNGNYSPDVEDAVARFQSARDIPEQSGVYGPQTREAVESETSEP
ncbi:peptidoglycan-binding domain-containing protein [Streptomyces cavernicola]|uniref:Peptidoglycan-binding domain-containing protein n=1 Tax=Streptomyces cavernicola TaxID=3043613 RepID=A0ABT6SCI9_9ACTN|nr:peptidoglycan-binding domain-containing protein [Streptomyces sp. B-S-A6]MDI3405367.1 peptidoglycan-binding domain-containing protein [Streptomyces sp. B-S-A6]